jgi:C-terminal processing protease CtpA/Prc
MPIDAGTQIIAIAIELIETLYVHLPLKRAMYAVNPVQRLRLLQRRLATAAVPLSERQFYDEMLSIFAQLRDLHTSFVLPEPFRSATAYLPFRLEACVENGRRLYVVSDVMPGAPKRRGFGRGAVVTHWNGVPIERAVASNAEREAGSNAAARHAQGLAALTMRWLGQSLPPDEDWIDVTFLPASTRARPLAARFTWNVFLQKSSAPHEIAQASSRSEHLGMDARGEVERQVRSRLFARTRARSARHAPDVDRELSSAMPAVFRSARDVETPSGRYAYLRIATFNVADDAALVAEFVRLVSKLSQDGLILDVRGNGGGLIHAGQRLLQLLTPGPIEPARFHFLNSARTELLSRRRPFRAWNRSIAQAVETGAEYSQGLPLLPIEACNDIGQKYQGPVVLVTDALCYSTTDIVAAGFQDHGIGPVLGVDENTGAGGANVWDYTLVAELLRQKRRFPGVLPGHASFHLAVRRVTRVGRASGLPLEDLGVVPDERHELTRRDVLERNVDLIARAAQILRRLPRQRLVATHASPGEVAIACSNVDRVDAYLQGRPHASVRVRPSGCTLQVPETVRLERELRLEGFRRGRLVVATRLVLATAGAGSGPAG